MCKLEATDALVLVAFEFILEVDVYPVSEEYSSRAGPVPRVAATYSNGVPIRLKVIEVVVLRRLALGGAFLVGAGLVGGCTTPRNSISGVSFSEG